MQETSGLAAAMADAVMVREGLLTRDWRYDFSVVWRGMEMLHHHTGDERYLAYIRDALDGFLLPDGRIRGYRMEDYNLDYISNGRQLLYLYRVTGEEKYLRAAGQLRKQLTQQPRTPEGGFWHKLCYPHQMWLDGLHMSAPFYVEYALLTHEGDAALADAAHQLVLAYERTYDPATGLNRHGWDASGREAWAVDESGRSAHAWGRAMGWYIVALVDVIDLLSQHGRAEPRLNEIFTRMAQALLDARRSGVWMQVLDCPDRLGNYAESSATFLITYALLKGARLGLAPCGEQAEASYRQAVERFVLRMRDGRLLVGGSCQGAGLGGRFYRDGSYDYYLSEPVISTDLKATGAMIQAACEYEFRAEERRGQPRDSAL